MSAYARNAIMQLNNNASLSSSSSSFRKSSKPSSKSFGTFHEKNQKQQHRTKASRLASRSSASNFDVLSFHSNTSNRSVVSKLLAATASKRKKKRKLLLTSTSTSTVNDSKFQKKSKSGSSVYDGTSSGYYNTKNEASNKLAISSSNKKFRSSAKTVNSTHNCANHDRITEAKTKHKSSRSIYPSKQYQQELSTPVINLSQQRGCNTRSLLRSSVSIVSGFRKKKLFTDTKNNVTGTGSGSVVKCKVPQMKIQKGQWGKRLRLTLTTKSKRHSLQQQQQQQNKEKKKSTSSTIMQMPPKKVIWSHSQAFPQLSQLSQGTAAFMEEEEEYVNKLELEHNEESDDENEKEEQEHSPELLPPYFSQNTTDTREEDYSDNEEEESCCEYTHSPELLPNDNFDKNLYDRPETKKSHALQMTQPQRQKSDLQQPQDQPPRIFTEQEYDQKNTQETQENELFSSLVDSTVPCSQNGLYMSPSQNEKCQRKRVDFFKKCLHNDDNVEDEDEIVIPETQDTSFRSILQLPKTTIANTLETKTETKTNECNDTPTTTTKDGTEIQKLYEETKQNLEKLLKETNDEMNCEVNKNELFLSGEYTKHMSEMNKMFENVKERCIAQYDRAQHAYSLSTQSSVHLHSHDDEDDDKEDDKHHHLEYMKHKNEILEIQQTIQKQLHSQIPFLNQITETQLNQMSKVLKDSEMSETSHKFSMASTLKQSFKEHSDSIKIQIQNNVEQNILKSFFGPDNNKELKSWAKQVIQEKVKHLRQGKTHRKEKMNETVTVAAPPKRSTNRNNRRRRQAGSKK